MIDVSKRYLRHRGQVTGGRLGQALKERRILENVGRHPFLLRLSGAAALMVGPIASRLWSSTSTRYGWSKMRDALS
jgi:hypothetical protein